jgi:hypothetical protein
MLASLDYSFTISAGRQRAKAQGWHPRNGDYENRQMTNP